MARRRRLHHTLLWEDAHIAASLAAAVGTLAARHPDIIALRMAERTLKDASADLNHAAQVQTEKAPAVGELLET